MNGTFTLARDATGAEIACNRRMRAARVLTTALLIGAIAEAAAADPITSPDAVISPSDPLELALGTPLLDSSGVPFMITGAPMYYGGVTSSNGASHSGEAAADGANLGPVLQPLVYTFFSSTISSSVAGSTNDGANDFDGGRDPSSQTTGGDTTYSLQSDDGQNTLPAVPEPGTFLLVGSGAALALRRRWRQAHAQ
jgi:hypothetical protein